MCITCLSFQFVLRYDIVDMTCSIALVVACLYIDLYARSLSSLLLLTCVVAVCLYSCNKLCYYRSDYYYRSSFIVNIILSLF